MPRITITLTKEEYALLREVARENQRGPAQMAERLLGRTLLKRPAAGQAKRTAERAAERAHRHLQMLDWIERNGGWEAVATLEGKRRLQEAFGVGQRTVYRDLDVLARLRRLPTAREPEAATADDENEPDSVAVGA